MDEIRIDINEVYTGRNFNGYEASIFYKEKLFVKAPFLRPSDIRERILPSEINKYDVEDWFGFSIKKVKKLLRLVEGSNPLSRCNGTCNHTTHTSKPKNPNFISELEDSFTFYDYTLER